MGDNTGSNEISVRPKVRTLKKQPECHAEPLERRKLRFHDRNGDVRQCGALDKKFSNPLIFVKYEAPTSKEEKSATELQKWLKNAKQFESNLQIVLCLPHHRFWSTVVNETCLHVALESYLSNAPKYYALHTGLINDEMKRVVNSVHVLVFKVYLRLATNPESKEHFMMEKFYGEIIYSKFIFDVPKLIDLCTIYSGTNQHVQALVKQIVENVFKANKKFGDHLSTVISGFVNYMEHLKEPFDEIAGRNSLSSYEWPVLLNLIYNITDLSVAISSFVSTSPMIAKQFHQEMFEPVIANFHEVIFVALQADLEARFETIPELQLICATVKRQVVIARTMLVNAFRQIIASSMLDALHDESVDMHDKHLMYDQLFDILSEALGEKNFAKDYFERYPIETDIRLLKENAYVTGFNNVDQTRIDYLLQTKVEESAPVIIHNDLKPEISKAVEQESAKLSKVENDSYEQLPAHVQSAVGGVGDVELMSMISSIKDLLPELGEGFIEACLIDFQYDVERTIDALCTDNVSPEIGKLDRTISRQEYARVILKPSLPSVLASRANIFDGDEFDIFRRNDVDVSKIHLGKLETKMEDKVDNDMKEKIKMLDRMKLEEEADEEERLYMEECQRALDEKDKAEKDVRDAESKRFYEEERQRREEALVGDGKPTSDSSRGRGRGKPPNSKPGKPRVRQGAKMKQGR